MKKKLLLILILIINISKAQKCTNISQTVDSQGIFRIKTNANIVIDKNKTFIEIDELVEVENTEIQTEFIKSFPEIINDKCININAKNPSNFPFTICRDFANLENQDKQVAYMKGSFDLVNKSDDWYFFKVKAFEYSGYYVFNSKDKKFYFFQTKPYISSDKKMIYSFSEDNHRFQLSLLKSNFNSQLNYEVSGKFAVDKIKAFKHFDDYGLIIELDKKKLVIGNDILDAEECKLKLEIT